MIRLASPDIREEDITRVVEVLRSGNLVQGKYVEEFEKGIAQFTKMPGTVVVSSCTAALHLTFKALDLKAGSNIIVPAFTFPATANVVEWEGFNSILCDVQFGSYVISAEMLEDTIKQHSNKIISAVIVVHEFGCPADLEKIAAIAAKYKLKVIEDAACAFGSIVNGHSPGYFSDAACYSFHPRKALTTGEGGAITSNDNNLLSKIRQLRNHGIEYSKSGMDFSMAGLNYRMTDFQAALAIGQLERFSEELKKRQILVKRYFSNLSGNNNFLLPEDITGHSWQSFMICLTDNIDRENVIKKLGEKDIQVNLGAQALHCLTYYKNKYNFSDADYPIACRLFKKGLVLPLYGKLTERDIDYICENLHKVIDQ